MICNTDRFNCIVLACFSMKRISILLIIVMLIGCLAGCNTDTTDTTSNSQNQTTAEEVTGRVEEPTGSHNGVSGLSETELALLKILEIPRFNESFPTMTWRVEIEKPELLKMYSGLDSLGDVIEMSVMQSATDMIGIDPVVFNLVLVKLSTSKNAASIADSMKNGIDISSWPQVNRDNVKTYVVDNFIIMSIMTEDLYSAIGDATWGSILRAYLSNRN